MTFTRSLTASLALLLIGCTADSYTPTGPGAPGIDWGDDPAPTEDDVPGGPVSPDAEADKPVADPTDDASLEECGNGVDDDLDGLADCVDPECASQPLCEDTGVRMRWSFDGCLWALYAADEDEVVTDDSGVEGFVTLSVITGPDADPQVECATMAAVSGQRGDDGQGYDLLFELDPMLPAEMDGCDLGDSLPEPPEALGLMQDSGDVAVRMPGEGWADGWTVETGVIDWSEWATPDEYSVFCDEELHIVGPTAVE